MTRETMPVLFVGHGNPMNAIEDNAFHRAWRDVARRIPKPQSVLCISAHWETDGVRATAAEKPETIHDFYGFPRELSEFVYPAPGAPTLARDVRSLVRSARVELDTQRGLDHGCWSVLCAMYPDAEVPVVQLSLDATQLPRFHYRLGQELAPLRERGVLILGSGDIVHNLRLFRFGPSAPFDWALRFNDEVKRRIASGDHASLVAYEDLGPDAELAAPTPEHYLPLLCVLGVRGEGERAEFFADEVSSSASMTSFLLAGN